MREETVAGHDYRIGRLNATKQFHVIRRIAPVLTAGGAAVKTWVTKRPNGEYGEQLVDGTVVTPPAQDLTEMFGAFGPLAKALGDLPDETCEYVIGTCLSACLRNTGSTTWARVATEQRSIMFDDLTMPEMLNLTLLVLQENFADFLGGVAGSSNGRP